MNVKIYETSLALSWHSALMDFQDEHRIMYYEEVDKGVIDFSRYPNGHARIICKRNKNYKDGIWFYYNEDIIIVVS